MPKIKLCVNARLLAKIRLKSRIKATKSLKEHILRILHLKSTILLANMALAGLFCGVLIVLLGGCANKASLERFGIEEKTRFFALMEQISSARYALYKRDIKGQMALLKQACEYRLGLACWVYAYEENGDKKAWSIPLERAALTLKSACLVMATQKPSIASGQSCAFLGIMLSQYPQMQVHIWELIGRNIQVEWLYKKACEMGEGWGCYRLSYDFLQPNGDTNAIKVANEGLKMTAAMCDRGVGYYCALSGVIYQYPLPHFVPSEEVRQERMRYFWEKGCLKKDGDSCIYLENLNNGEYKNAYYPNKALPNRALQDSGYGLNTNKKGKKSKRIKSFSDELDYSKLLDSSKEASKKDFDKEASPSEKSSEKTNAKSSEKSTESKSKPKEKSTKKESTQSNTPKSSTQATQADSSDLDSTNPAKSSNSTNLDSANLDSTNLESSGFDSANPKDTSQDSKK